MRGRIERCRECGMKMPAGELDNGVCGFCRTRKDGPSCETCYGLGWTEDQRICSECHGTGHREAA